LTIAAASSAFGLMVTSAPYCYPIAIDLLSRGLATSKGIVTHDYPLERWDEAIEVANSLDSIKVLMKPAR
jgi:L-iditol 2-dehydrogenase